MHRLLAELYKKGGLLLSLTALFWGSNFVIGRGIGESFPPIALAYWRWTLGTLMILPFAIPYLKKEWPIIKDHLPYLIVMGILGGGCFNTMTYYALTKTTATNALLLNAANPAFVFLANFYLFQIKTTKTQIIGALLSILGVFIIILEGNWQKLATLNFNHGDLWVLAAMVLWAIYTVYLKKRPSIHWLSFCALTFGAASLSNLPLVVYEHYALAPVVWTWSNFTTVLYIALFPAVLGYIFFNRGVELMGSNRAGIYLNLVPVFGTGLAILFIGEQPAFYHLTGFALILFGVWMAGK